MLRKRNNEFEDYIQEGFAAIREQTGAWLLWVNPPVVCCGMRGKMPIFAMVGTAPYDVGGWAHGDYMEPRAIGVELKESRKYKSSLPIIGLEKKGSGLQYHQIEALAALHREGHYAGVLWNNGGAIGFASGDVVASAFYDYEVSRIAEENGQRPVKGSRSISWSQFSVVIGETPDAWFLENLYVPKERD